MSTPDLPAGVRVATPDDIPTILELVHELAAFEREPDAVKATPDLLHAAHFGPDPVASTLLATDDDGAVIGMALWYRTFSTWEGVPGMHLEDLYVRPQARGAGTGRLLFTALAREAQARGLTRLEWVVLRWNEQAIGFYDALGGEPQDDWQTYRLETEGIAALAR